MNVLVALLERRHPGRSCRMLATRLQCDSMAAFGMPVVPPVYWKSANVVAADFDLGRRLWMGVDQGAGSRRRPAPIRATSTISPSLRAECAPQAA